MVRQGRTLRPVHIVRSRIEHVTASRRGGGGSLHPLWLLLLGLFGVRRLRVAA
ncbi:MAG: GlyGly-CTERM sorting domain-containing protein [Candidatus Thiodiazotropha sp. (ex Dulcina madagascariensis)]|nr:GlyGly-CTERM sorting domain-containing protein [Candidatus Thiodiazotropha sp. (ex Dulcina madagascariensis)]